jgi:Uma2 family endonuclease
MSVEDRTADEANLQDFRLPAPGRMTEEEFLAWCDEDVRAEWVDGEVVMMAPASVEHGDVDGWLVQVVGIFVEQRDLGKVLSEAQVRLAGRHSRRMPDLLFVAKDRLSLLRPNHLEGAPDLIMEIVSPESESRDWREKYLEYQAAGVREYWVIDPMSQHVEAYALAAQDSPAGAAVEKEYRRLEEKDGIIRSTVLAGFYLRTSWLWPKTRPKALEALRELGVVGPA